MNDIPANVAQLLADGEVHAYAVLVDDGQRRVSVDGHEVVPDA